jgi:Alginate lyase
MFSLKITQCIPVEFFWVVGLLMAFSIKAQTLEEVKPSGLRLAQAELNKTLHSVMDKAAVPPSGDFHDWVTQAPYWWADPKNPKGKYIRHDGKRNPEIDRWRDDQYFNEMLKSTELLSQAYVLSQDERYAVKAIENLRLWFISRETRMNPNMTYGQFIPGITQGRGEGIIATRFIFKVPMILERLKVSKSWTQEDNQSISRWFESYLDWLKNSDIGQEEARHVNNHFTWYMVQVVSIELYLGQLSQAQSQLKELRDHVLEGQVTSEGLQPHELERTKSFSYSSMNLHAWWVLADLAKRAQVDFFSTPAGQRLFLATDALIPYSDLKRWPYPQLDLSAQKDLCRAIDWVQRFSNDTKYPEAEQRFQCPQNLESYFIKHES